MAWPRIARNTQLILLEESQLARVADPAAGSGAIEDLTEKLCLAAWSLFQTLDAMRWGLGRPAGGCHSTRRCHDTCCARKGDSTRHRCADRHERLSELARKPVDVLHVPLAPQPVEERRHGAPFPRSAWPSPMNHCAMPLTGCWRRPTQGRKCSLPTSARRPTSPPARHSPGTSSKRRDRNRRPVSDATRPG